MNNGKYKPELVETVLKNITEGYSAKRACTLSCISEDTFYEWKKIHPEFAESVKKAQAQFIRIRMGIISKAGLTSWQACAWQLERLLPDEFGLRTHQQISGYLERGETDAEQKERKVRITRRLNEILEEKMASLTGTKDNQNGARPAGEPDESSDILLGP